MNRRDFLCGSALAAALSVVPVAAAAGFQHGGTFKVPQGEAYLFLGDVENLACKRGDLVVCGSRDLPLKVAPKGWAVTDFHVVGRHKVWLSIVKL